MSYKNTDKKRITKEEERELFDNFKQKSFESSIRKIYPKLKDKEFNYGISKDFITEKKYISVTWGDFGNFQLSTTKFDTQINVKTMIENFVLKCEKMDEHTLRDTPKLRQLILENFKQQRKMSLEKFIDKKAK